MTSNNLNWYFPKVKNAYGRGQNDPQKELFPGPIYQTLIRESIQNSLDHPNCVNTPVKVIYKIRSFPSDEFTGLKKLRTHIQSCFNISKADKFRHMLEVLEAPYISILDVSDYNTIGMDYDYESDTGRFKKFVRYTGDPNDIEGTGGSHGHGKIAYFTISEINTIIVSSMTQDGLRTFEGVSRLASHPAEEIHFSYLDTGFWDEGDGAPLQEKKGDAPKIPDVFRREEPGTTVSIPFVNITDKAKIFGYCCEAVLRNFFAAINDGTLEVLIDFGDGYEFDCNQGTIEKLFSNRFFYNPSYDTAKNNIFDRFNPNPYWQAYRNNDITITEDFSDEEAAEACVGKKYIRFKKTLPILGDTSLYLNVDNQRGNDVVLFMRCPRMVVGAQRNKTFRGYSAVFLCDDKDKGNKLLRNMEDAAHRTWSKRQLEIDKRPQDMIEQASEIENEMRLFIQSCLDIVFPPSQTDSDDVELEEFTMPLITESDTMNPLIGSLINKQGNNEEVLGAPVDLHAGLQSSSSQSKYIGRAQIKEPKKVKETEKDTEISGGENKHNRKRRHKHRRKYEENSDMEEKIVRVKFPVKYRVFSDETNDGQVLYTLIIHSPHQEEKAYLTIKPVGETDDKSCNVHIKTSSVGKVKENEINEVPLMEGKNIIKFTVDDQGEYAFSLLAEHDVTIKPEKYED